MKRLIAVLFAATLCLVAGCASRGAADSAARAGTGGSGLTVFGTVDAGVSGTRNQSR